MQRKGCASLQVIFNIFRQKLVKELLPHAAKANVGLLARVPLASGLLTGKFAPGHVFGASDHRGYNADGQAFNVGETFAGVGFEKGLEMAEKVKAILGPSAKVSMAELSLRWVLDHPQISSVIPGATKLSQAVSNVNASALPRLTQAQHEALTGLYESQIAPLVRGKY
jgi:aryl-alcohol dehydrogenase-like predicted oxidoreductase